VKFIGKKGLEPSDEGRRKFRLTFLKSFYAECLSKFKKTMKRVKEIEKEHKQVGEQVYESKP